MVCINGRLIGDEKELARWAHEVWEFTLHRPHALNLALAEDYYSNYLRDTEASNTHTHTHAEQNHTGLCENSLSRPWCKILKVYLHIC